ncbi:MAG: cytochrome c biogenesis protein CcdA [Candidatus Aenigmarchaeota archaeon]|nr:cytochrome c biogenesis protein CcdA [Candidatus Aenigmarchaeota archaeon]
MKNEYKFRILLTSLILASIFGYLTFSYFVVKIMPGVLSLSLFIVAIVAGIAAFFNPCSFAVLPAYITGIFLRKERKAKRERIVYYGVLVALGIVTFNLILGILMGILGEGFVKSFTLAHPFVRIFRGGVGLILLTLGLMYLFGRGFHYPVFEKIGRSFQNLKTTSANASMYVYGFSYNAIGIACTGPILTIVLVSALAGGSFVSALFTFSVYSFTMALMMVFVSTLSAYAKEELINKLKANVGKIKKVSGIILIIFAIFLTISSVYPQEISKLFSEMVPKSLIEGFK